MDHELERLLEVEQYTLAAPAKGPALIRGLNGLTGSHRDRCAEYARVLRATHPGLLDAAHLDEVPHLPVSLFKWLELKSVSPDEVFKVLTSSGTTSQVTSRIYLDVETARLQTRALSSIVSNYLGPRRRPMLIIDHPNVVKDRRHLSARGAGILGMLSYGRDHLYVLDEDMRLDRRVLDAWLKRHAGEELLLFGFTFLVWVHFYEVLRDVGIDLSKATLVHSGGWKRMADIAVSNEIFRAQLGTAFGLERVHNFYGMAEQVGSVFFECPAGYFPHPELRGRSRAGSHDLGARCNWRARRRRGPQPTAPKLPRARSAHRGPRDRPRHRRLPVWTDGQTLHHFGTGPEGRDSGLQRYI